MSYLSQTLRCIHLRLKASRREMRALPTLSCWSGTSYLKTLVVCFVACCVVVCLGTAMLEHLLQLCERDGTFDNIYLYAVYLSFTCSRTLTCCFE